MYQLHIANKNYSSWSLRPWILMKALDIPFGEIMHPFGQTDNWDAYRTINPAGLVPSLLHNEQLVWDSLAIVEHLAEHHAGVWPSDTTAKIWARSAAAEMHSGFFGLRESCSMSCGQRVTLHELSKTLQKDLARLDHLWCEGLTRFGGPYLAGEQFTAVDAFYAPVVFRLQTYGLSLSDQAMAYVDTMLAHPHMVDWYQQALEETFRDVEHDEEIDQLGVVNQDFRTASA